MKNKVYSGLSVCIITKNEEKYLEACLASVYDIADEIILADTGSEDRTIEIAAKYDCEIHKIDWKDDFSYARNFTLNKAKYGFILIIDADERLLNPDQLANVLNNSTDEYGGYLIEVVSESGSGNSGNDKYISNLLRLFRNEERYRFKGIIHEQIIESILSNKSRIMNTGIRIEHLGYNISQEELLRKQLRNLELLDRALEKNSNDAYNLLQRAKTYLALNNPEKAEKDFELAIEYSSENGAVKPQALNYGALSAFRNGNTALAEKRAEDSIRIIPGQSFGYFILGEIKAGEGNHKKAYEYYKTMQENISKPDPKAQIIGDFRLPQEQVHFRLGRSLAAMNFIKEAVAEYTKAIEINDKDIYSLVGMAEIAFNYKQYSEAKTFLTTALKTDKNNQDLIRMLNQVEEASGKKTKDKINIPTGRNILSLSMIVKNEEKHLPGCLDSVKGIVDEIIIVDTGSTDNTKEITKEYGAKLIDFEWINDFAAARNESLRNCSGEWILYLDADERLNAKSKEIIINLILNAPDEMGAYICTIESNHIQLDGNTELHRGGYPRLFRNYGYPKIEFKGKVHEQITPAIFALGKSIDFSDIIIEHLGYNLSREEMEKKIKRNYGLLMKHVNEEPTNSYAWYQLGQTLAQMEMFKESESAIRFSIELGSLSDSVYASAAATLSQICGNKKLFEEALHWAEESLKKSPDQMYALNLKAYSLLYLNKPEEAETLFLLVRERVSKSGNVPKSGFDIVIPDKIIEHGLKEAKRLKSLKGS